MKPKHFRKIQGADDVSVEHKERADDVLFSKFDCPTSAEWLWFFVDNDGFPEIMCAEVFLDLVPAVVHREHHGIDFFRERLIKWEIIGSLSTGKSDFALVNVNGRSLVPKPPARIIASIMFS